ncbi:MAG: TetR/AcrR family transcriptional regulator [Phycisphaerales bacterium]|nr:TetR/AcrR family transcriptional regulator [Phycisphaerales bacterium]
MATKFRPKNLKSEERRAIIVEAVVELAAVGNPNDITTAAIARQMELTQGALFRHFSTKDQILEAVMAWAMDRLLERVDNAIDDAQPPLRVLERVFFAHVDFMSDHPGVPRILFGEMQRPETTPSRQVAQILLERYGDRLRRLFQLGIDRGELQPELNLDSAVILFIGTIQGLVMQSLLAGDPTRMQAEAPGVFAIYRRGIGRAP